MCVCVRVCARECLCVCVFGLRSLHLSTISLPSSFPLSFPLSLSLFASVPLPLSLTFLLSRSLALPLPFSHALVYAIASEVLLLYLRKGVISPLCHERSGSPAHPSLPLSLSPSLPCTHIHSHAEHTSKTTARGAAKTSSLQILNVSTSMIYNYLIYFNTCNILARPLR
jgi:hypothetical protein